MNIYDQMRQRKAEHKREHEQNIARARRERNRRNAFANGKVHYKYKQFLLGNWGLACDNDIARCKSTSNIEKVDCKKCLNSGVVKRVLESR